MIKAGFWTAVAVLYFVLDILFEPNGQPWGVGHGLFAWAIYGPWILSYWLRNKHVAFMWIHRDLYLDIWKWQKRLIARWAPIFAAAAAMEMYRQSSRRR